MEDISKYLDNLFAQLPNTPEARHAREELGQMMEDRYAELCAKGMGEKDAASAAIAEFGSLEEVRESLGLGAQPAAAQPADAQPAAAQPADTQPAAAQPACQRPAAASASAAQTAPPRPQGTSGPVPPHVEQPPQLGSASPEKRHNHRRHVLLVTCIVVAAVVAAVAWNGVSAGIRGAFGDGTPIGQSASSGASGKVEKDVDASFGSVDVDVDMADVVVRAGDSAHVSCTGAKEFSYACDVKGGVLTVTQEARHEHVRGTGGKVVVTVPRGASLRRVTAECEMGDVTLNGKSMGSSYATHGSGNSGSQTLKATSEMDDITVGN